MENTKIEKIKQAEGGAQKLKRTLSVHLIWCQK